MITNPNGDWEDNFDPDLNDQSGIGDTPSLEEQEQLNSANLVQRMEAENESADSDKSQTIDQPSEGEEDLTGFLEKRASEPNMNVPAENDKPTTRNLLGDNPPGAEKIVFESGNPGDASAEHFKYDEDSIEGFRENLDKTEQQINIDKKLKEDNPD
jgi:hypothetical protein